MQDPNILNIVWGFEITFPCAGKINQPSSFEIGTTQACQIETQRNVVEMCNTASITMQKSVSQQPVTYIKGIEGNRSVMKLKHLNNFISYKHLKMEGRNLLQNILQKKDYMCNCT